MNVAKRWLATPLAGTAGVMAGLALLAIPLRTLTSATNEAAAVPAAAPAEAEVKQVPAVLRLRLLAPAKGLTLKTGNDNILLGPLDLDAGEFEYDVNLSLSPADGLELALDAELPDAGDSAVFLTVMPDAYEDQTRYAIGQGVISESLHYEWHVHNH